MFYWSRIDRLHAFILEIPCFAGDEYSAARAANGSNPGIGFSYGPDLLEPGARRRVFTLSRLRRAMLAIRFASFTLRRNLFGGDGWA